MAFLDHRPVFKGHVLVCPVLHVDTFTDLPAHLVAPLFIVVQSVPHLHVHVVPRWGGDANFITIIGGSKVIPQLLRDTRRLLADEWAKQQ